jgi:hypothetical protein
VPEIASDFFQGERALSTHIIESRPAGYRKEQVGDPGRWFALPVLLTGALLPILDFNVVNLALPAIRGDLGASSSEVQFVISAYAATYAVFLITGGRLGDLLGQRMFLWGVAGFTIASLLCGVASSPGILVGERILQPRRRCWRRRCSPRSARCFHSMNKAARSAFMASSVRQ